MADSGQDAYTYKQLTIDYSLLNDAATDIKGLSPEIKRIKNAVKPGYRSVVETVPGLVNENNLELGPGDKLYHALGAFYAKWRTDMSNAMDALDKMAGYFKGVADSFMETDASQAAGLNLSAAMSEILRYPVALDQWYTDKANTEHAHKTFSEPKPVDPTSPFQLASGNNAVTTFTTTTDTNVPSADKSVHATNVVLSSETTTVTVGGQTYSETTTYQADQGWGNGVPTQNTTQVIHNPDGSTDTVTMTTDTSGHGTMTDLNSSTKETTTYTRANWSSDWVDVTPKDDSSSGDGSDNGVDPAPFVN